MTEIFSKLRKTKKFLGKRVWRLFWISLILGISLFLVESSFIVILQGFLRTIGFVDNKQTLLPDWYPTKLTYAMLILLLFGVFRGIIYMVRYYIIGAIAEVFSTLQRQRILEYGLRYPETISSGQIFAIFTERVTQSAGVLQAVSQLIVTLSACMLFFVYGTMKAPLEMLIGVSSVLILMIPLRRFNSVIVQAGNGLRSEWDKVNNILIQGLRNHFFFKIYDLVEDEIDKANKYLKEYDEHFQKFYRVSAIKNHTPNIIGIFIICTITFVSVRYIHTRPVLLISFFYIFIRFTQGLSEASTARSNFKLHFNGFLELYYWHTRLELSNIKRSEEKKIEPLAHNPFASNIEIEVKNLTFGYPQQKPLFHDLNLSVKKGEILLIKGPSGVGKSTLLLIILGFLKPDKGSIEFNQHDVQKITPFLSELIGYVGPEPHMIVGTIKENILFGIRETKNITDEMIINAMNKAQLDVNQFKLDFFVAEQAALSTGQKQRLSIARAILRNPKLLILDEATANLDGDTETRFTENIKEMLKEVTTIIISHKPSFDKIATNTLILERSQEQV